MFCIVSHATVQPTGAPVDERAGEERADGSGEEGCESAQGDFGGRFSSLAKA